MSNDGTESDPVVGHFDVQCPHCGHRHGWSGMADRPALCRICGRVDPRPLVGPDLGAIAEFRDFLRRRKADRENRRAEGRCGDGPSD